MIARLDRYLGGHSHLRGLMAAHGLAGLLQGAALGLLVPFLRAFLSGERGAAGARHLQRWVGREARHRPAKPFTPVRIRYPPRAIGAAGARFPDTEEVTGSIPVSPTICKPRQRRGFFISR